MESKITEKQLKIILKIVLRSRRAFESLVKESGMDYAVDFPTQLSCEQADIIIKAHSGFLI